MQKLLTAAVAVAVAFAPAAGVAQGRITGQQSYVTGSKPNAETGKSKVVKTKKPKAGKAPPGKYQVVKIKPAKAVHHKHSHRIAKAPRYAKASYYRHGHQHRHWEGHRHWLLPAIVGTAIGLGLFRLWH